MDINTIRDKVEEFYKVDITEKNRRKQNIKAKKIFCYVACVVHNYPVGKVGKHLNLNHGSAIHLRDSCIQSIEIGYKDVINDIYNIFNIDLTLGRTMEKIESLISRINIEELPINKVDNLVERINAAIRGYNIKPKQTESTIYEGHGTYIQD